MKRIIISILAIISIGLTAISCSDYDDSGLWNEIKDIKGQITKLNADVSSLKTIVDAQKDGKTITDVKATTSGYDITFSDGKTITVTNGKNGSDAPVIGIKDFEGIYYWTITTAGKTDFLYDTAKPDQKIPVSGKDAKAPKLTVNAEGYWEVDGVKITDANGNFVKAVGENGDSFFKAVEAKTDEVIFTLADGSKITLPRSEGLKITIAATGEQFVKLGATKEFDITQSGIVSYTISKPDGWKVSLTGLKLHVTAPDEKNGYAEQSGMISIIGVGKNATAIATLNVKTGLFQLLTMDVESATEDPNTYASSKYGENLYSSGTGDKIMPYYDPNTDLAVAMNTTDFWSGGLVPSIYNDMTEASYQNQCSVYYKDPVTSLGGHNGSQAFIVAYCSVGGMGGGNSNMDFQTVGKEAVIDHVFITNGTYAYLSMLNGDSFAKKFSYTDKDWFKLTFVGYNKSGVKTGSVDFYMADFRTPSSPGIVTEWTKVDLSSLGKVNKIEFLMDSSDVGSYGMNTPGYFCMDDIVVRGE
ncbi:MAG: DUF4465 domain-containing protein [Rikenellaceae bacterium]